MENWIGVGIWIVLGAGVGLAMRALVKRPEERPGHAAILLVFGAFGAVIGGMLGVGLFHFDHPTALSLGGFAGAIALSALLTWVYRWGLRTLI
jgi:hypothetical protein